MNPLQIAKNFGLIDGEVSNDRKVDARGNPLLHGTNEGHVWYDRGAYVNGKFIDFAGVRNVNSNEGIENIGKPPVRFIQYLYVNPGTIHLTLLFTAFQKIKNISNYNPEEDGFFGYGALHFVYYLYRVYVIIDFLFVVKRPTGKAQKM